LQDPTKVALSLTAQIMANRMDSLFQELVFGRSQVDTMQDQ
jgi:hypothetical protein